MADMQTFQLGQQMQGRLQQLQADLATRQITASAGAGLVRVVVDGGGTLRSVVIDPAAFEGRDADLLGDLVLAAVAEAQRRAADIASAELGRVPGVPFTAQP